MSDSSAPLCTDQLTDRQRDLQSRLTKAVHQAIPVERDLDTAERRAQGCYRIIAELLVELRHEFPGPHGEPHDLQGRSSAYRIAVREAYGEAGVGLEGPIPKRLTAGVSYWVRKILIERYGEKALYKNGIIGRAIAQGERCSDPSKRTIEGMPNDPAARLALLIGMLNSLAVDPRCAPSEEAVRSAFRAVLLLRNRLRDDLKSRRKALRGHDAATHTGTGTNHVPDETPPLAVFH